MDKISSNCKSLFTSGRVLKKYPFIDGNGRTARIALNFELMKNRYPPIIFKKDSRLNYYDSLYIAQTKFDYFN